MTLSYQSSAAFLYSASLQKPLFSTSAIQSNSSHRLDMLYSCLEASKGLLDLYLVQPLSYFMFSVLDLGHLGMGMSVLLRLTIVEENGWDLTYVRQTANLGYYFERLIAKFRSIGSKLDENQPPGTKRSFHTGCSLAMGKVLKWYESTERLKNSYEERIAAENDQSALDQDATMGMEEFMANAQFDYFDEGYWLQLVDQVNTVPESI